MKLTDLWKRHGFAFVAALAIVLVILVSVSVAKAAGSAATVAWDHPTMFVDGSALSASDIKETIVMWRRPGRTAILDSVHIAAPATQTVVPGLTCGSFSFTLVTVMISGAISVESSPVTYSTGIACAPNPPSNLKVT